MDIKGILTIAGQGGLFRMISQGKNAVIVEHLDTGKRMPSYASARISQLEDISIYTQDDELPLTEIFKRIMVGEQEKEIPDPRKLSNEQLKNYFNGLVPDYDTDRVYVSDIKKVLLWYNELLKHGLLHKEPEAEEENPEESEETGTQDIPAAE